ncbi:MAG: hypothetical protein KDD64_14650, partial [Bdellovibrionales bacterium]|nr:hypothetical protein [Bdellovibrionales bacterium]
MKTLTVKALLLFVLALTPFSSCLAADSAEGLVKALTQAIKDKDISAANALVDWRNAPVVAYRFFQMSIADCFDPPFCKVSTGPLEEADRSPQGGYVYAVQPEALLKVIPGDGNGDLTLPFAKVGSEYKIVMTQDTPETIARAKA